MLPCDPSFTQQMNCLPWRSLSGSLYLKLRINSWKGTIRSSRALGCSSSGFVSEDRIFPIIYKWCPWPLWRLWLFKSLTCPDVLCQEAPQTHQTLSSPNRSSCALVVFSTKFNLFREGPPDACQAKASQGHQQDHDAKRDLDVDHSAKNHYRKSHPKRQQQALVMLLFEKAYRPER